MNLRIYTDGAYSSARNQGGIGIVIIDEESSKLLHQVSKGYTNTTNNRMELTAILMALRCITGDVDKVTIVSDSMYAIGSSCIGTLKYKRKKNLDLLAKLDEVVKNKRQFIKELDIQWVKGHFEDEFNDIADKLAVNASQELL